MKFLNVISALTLSLLPVSHGNAQDKVIRIYQDADRSNHIESAISIERGILTALDEVNNRVAGYRVEYIPLDHRGNVLRSKQNYDKFIADDQAIAIFSGIHSPPLIKNREFINQNKALTIVPWAAGAPITRYPSTENWVFRVSLDDARAGGRLVDHALDIAQCAAPHLLLESTPWGDSNLVAMSDRLKGRDVRSYSVSRFGMNLKEGGANILLQKIVQQGSDCIILVGNAIEGTSIAIAMAAASTENRMPIISHWGITGGSLFSSMGYEAHKKIEMTFIQSCFSFNDTVLNDHAQAVLKRAIKLFTEVDTASGIKSPVGFIHAYDATRLLLAAIKEAELTSDMYENRNAVRLMLENLQNPVQGLVKNYLKPFSMFDPTSNPNAHEALGPTDYCMGHYNSNGNIVLNIRKAQ